MDKEKLIFSIASLLVVGEALAGVVSKPIRAIGTCIHRPKPQLNAERVVKLFDAMNQRICDLENKLKKDEA